MNIVFLSPAFPPTAHLFCAALRDLGVTVLGIGDEPSDSKRAEFSALADYVFEPEMADYATLVRAVARLRDRHGPIDRIESNGERWLAEEARLRDDFEVEGLRLSDLIRHRSKLGMAETFASAGVPHPPGVRADSTDRVRAFATAHGLPLVFKPDTGSGATNTFAVSSPEELERALETDLSQHLVQPFVEGKIVTFDGLTNRAGKIVFSASHEYDDGIMQVRTGNRDGHYYSLRSIPPALEALGTRALAAFDLRERFFHLEFFLGPDGSYTALEMNLRPPGGFTTDMMNEAGNIDVYSLWARAITGDPLTDVNYQRAFHTAHAGRRQNRSYRIDHAQLVQELGPTLRITRPIPAAFADTMGDTMYLLRHPDLDSLRRAIALVQQT